MTRLQLLFNKEIERYSAINPENGKTAQILYNAEIALKIATVCQDRHKFKE